MLYTVTFSPSLDYAVTFKRFALGAVNRAESENIRPGGKGINVSVVLHNLGLESIALGFVAGFTGDEIERSLAQMGVTTRFIRTQGLSRINVKVLSQPETELNGCGPDIRPAESEALMRQLGSLQKGDVLVLAGTVPANLPADTYQRILQSIEGKDVLTVVDTNNELLKKVLPYKPFLVKPNDKELSELLGTPLVTYDDVTAGALRLREMGARNVIVSMGGRGAILAAESGEVYSAEAPAGKVVNTVGAGDSLVAGFLAGYTAQGDIVTAFRAGVATGSASAFSAELATRAEVEALFPSVTAVRER